MPGRSSPWTALLCAAGGAAAFVVPAVLGLGPTSLLLRLAVAAALVALASRHVLGSILVLVTAPVLQQLVLAYLLHVGTPAPLVRAAGGLKDVAVLGLVVAAVRHVPTTGRRPLDAVDRWASTYVALASAYLVLPLVVAGVWTPVPFGTRALAWRTDVLFVLVLLAVRRVGRPEHLRPVVAAVVAVATLTGAIAVLEALSPGTWDAVLSDVAHVREYQQQVLGVTIYGGDLLTHGTAGDADVVRAGSLLLSPTTLGFFLVPGLALVVLRLAQPRPRAAVLVAAVVVAAGIVASLTRAAVLAAVVVLGVGVWTALAQRAPGRVRLVAVLLLGALVALPVLSTSALADRTASSFGGQDSSTREHVEDVERGLAALVHAPLGLGLGTAAGVGDRFFVAGKLTSENAYLQVGNELGIPAMVAFLGLLLSTSAALRRGAARSGAAGLATAAVLAAAVGLLVGGLLQQVWLDFALSYTFWALAGLCLGLSAGARSTSTTAPVGTGAASTGT